MRADRELACDERVLQLAADSASALCHEGAAPPQRYGQTIVNVLHVLSRRAGRSPAVTAAGVLDGKNFLRRRITMIARLERSAGVGASRRRGLPLLGCVASVLVSAGGADRARARTTGTIGCAADSGKRNVFRNGGAGWTPRAGGRSRAGRRQCRAGGGKRCALRHSGAGRTP
jgi:hypothetical protein